MLFNNRNTCQYTTLIVHCHCAPEKLLQLKPFFRERKHKKNNKFRIMLSVLCSNCRLLRIVLARGGCGGVSAFKLLYARAILFRCFIFKNFVEHFDKNAWQSMHNYTRIIINEPSNASARVSRKREQNPVQWPIFGPSSRRLNSFVCASWVTVLQFGNLRTGIRVRVLVKQIPYPTLRYICFQTYSFCLTLSMYF